MRSYVFLIIPMLLVVPLAGFIGDDAQMVTSTDPIAQEGSDAHGGSWPPLEEAEIRPGVQITGDGHGWCTSNFVFTDQAGEIYLGTAAHCVDTSIGAQVRLQSDPDYFTGEQGPVIGTVHYSSRQYENVESVPCFVVLSCSSGPGNSANDFALIKIDPGWHDKVHPAVLHFGGPTGLAQIQEVSVNDPVLTYGNSPLRPGPSPLDWREGFVGSVNSAWHVSACIVTPGLPGDSGSNAMLGDGQALGVVITLGVGTPCAVVNGVTVLATALDFARQRGHDVELATWDLLNEGILP